MSALKFELGPALVAVAAIAMVGILTWKGKMDSTAAMAIVGSILTMSGLKPAVSKLPASERPTDPEGVDKGGTT